MQTYRKVVFIGDSITDVTFNKRMRGQIKGAASYPLVVAKSFPKQTKCFLKGIASNRSYHVYDRLTDDCIAYQPDLVVMLIGVNDFWQEYKAQDYPPCRRPFRAHYAELLRRLKAEIDGRVILMTPFLIDTIPEKAPFRAYIDRCRNEIRALNDAYGFEIIDLQSVFDRAQQQYAPVDLAIDGIHPTNLGHRLIAQTILERLDLA